MSSPPPWCRPCEEGVDVDLLVVPRASRTRAVGVHDGRLRVQLAAPPVDGAANAALVRWFATTLGVPRTGVHLLLGASGRRKRLRVEGATPEDVVTAFLGGDARTP